MNIATTDYSTNTNYRPYFNTVYEDMLPRAPQSFSVSPDENNPFYPKLTWSTADSDLWYGLLMISDKNIYNQYHNAIIHFPLNEEGIHGTAATAPTENIANSTTNVTASGVLYDIEGLAGYSLRFDGSNDYIEHNTGAASDPTSDCTTELTVIAHFIPDNASDVRYIISQNIYSGGSYNRDKFYLRLNASNQVEAKVGYDTSGNGITLTSSSVLVADGQTPSCAIITVDTTLKSGNVKLYVNGKLEDVSGSASTTASVNNWKQDSSTKQGVNITGGNSVIRIGGHLLYDTLSFDGKIEEVVIYKQVVEPILPTSKEFIINKPYSELVSGQSFAASKSFTARLFIKDYHNIRGKRQTEVSSSPQISWRKASFALDTT